jgi:putative SOS response-associated peptidase YedK
MRFTNGRNWTPRNKQPFAIAMKDGQPYAFAGLWERWKDRDAGGAELLTFTVITTVLFFDLSILFAPFSQLLPRAL